jgi:hypothetical protein
MAKRTRRLVLAWSKADVKNLRTFAKEKLSGRGARGGEKASPHARRSRAESDETGGSVPLNQAENALAATAIMGVAAFRRDGRRLMHILNRALGRTLRSGRHRIQKYCTRRAIRR